MKFGGKKIEYVELDLCPHIHSDSRHFVHVPVILPKLCSKVKKVNHSTVTVVEMTSELLDPLNAGEAT